MHIENMPFCCTSAIIGSFGEHGEESIVTVDEIKRLVERKRHPVYRGDEIINNGKRCVFAISVDPVNIAILRQAGFRDVDSYPGIQGRVHIMTLHLDPEA